MVMDWPLRQIAASCFLLISVERIATGAPINFSSIPPAQTIQESKDRFDARAKLVVDFFKDQVPLGTINHSNGITFFSTSMVRLAAGQNVEEVNRGLLDPASQAYALVGTDFHMGPCQRTGDYDFTLIGLARLPYFADLHSGLLSAAARQRLVNTFLTERGRTHYSTFDLGICGTRLDTENHILMVEISKYLTNQVLLKDLKDKGQYNVDFDNAATGFNYFMTDHLRSFLANDFSEFNSKPYQGYAVYAIQTLYEHARDSRVKLTTQMVLDYLSAKFAIQSAGLRRSVPFRRQPAYRDESRLLFVDSEAERHAILAGNYGALAHLETPYQPTSGYNFMLSAAIGKYRIPDVILGFMMHKGSRQVFQKFKHEGVEIYSASDAFTISAGGIFIDYTDWGSGELDAWAVPTTIVPARGGILRNDMIRIQGHRNFEKRNNTCVARGFACGLNPIIPATIPETCKEKNGNWTFLNFNSDACPLKMGFYAAVYSKACDSGACRNGGDSFGFFEAVDAREVPAYFNFKEIVLYRNGFRYFQSDRENTYVTTAGDEIHFIPAEESLDQWPITSINRVAQERRFDYWPLADGDFMQAQHDAKVTVTNPLTLDRLILDVTDFRRPKRSIIPGGSR